MSNHSSESQIFKPPLYSEHLRLNGKMISFAGWLMPVQYEKGIISEHIHTRENVSLFDICHMGELEISGAGAADALDRIFPRSVSAMKIGTCRYNFLLTEQGTVVDDLIIYRLSPDDFFLVVNASRKKDDFDYLSELLPCDVELKDVSSKIAKLDLQGPAAAEVLINSGLSQAELPSYYQFRKLSLFGEDVLVSRTGYTGELGYELYFDVDSVVSVWKKLLDYPEVEPAGLGARDTLRLEMGYPLYGHEMDLNTTPLEAGFSNLIKFEQDKEFIGKNTLFNSEPQKKLFGIALEGRRACRKGAEIFYNETRVGYVTSGGFSPSLSNSIALGYIDSASNPQIGMICQINIGRTVLNGKLVELPFYKNSSIKNNIG